MNNEEKIYSLPRIGEKAPSFKAKTTQGEINFPEDFAGKWLVLFSHPADFTPVCTTEFMTFASMSDEFKKINTELVGLSIDGIASHIAWLRKIRELKWNNLENIEVKFPLIEDIKMEVAKLYGMLHEKDSDTNAVRAVFIINPEGIIKTIMYYPSSTGRNIDEIIRVIKSLQKSEAEGIATPANWKEGEDVVLPPPGSCGVAKDRVEANEDDMYCLDWFLCFKKQK
jgi:3-cys thioredoxin peroxidase